MERWRLWLSYERYTALFVGTALSLVFAVCCFAPTAWYLWLIVAFPVFKLCSCAVEVHSNLSRKLHETAIATPAYRCRPVSRPVSEELLRGSVLSCCCERNSRTGRPLAPHPPASTVTVTVTVTVTRHGPRMAQ